ncbi:hypothetical protein EGR_06915 [Echinococcus granulosus]|uniref:Uncharacterized protein n=1 Tax=Echinococcus granulosus TaxID=6210 RepID=W6UC48_ECHGR|nr:hypothetical protein EGR_06915 [Echinococcus granulosus]EUB58171.1 hypothetical protein EGR_06915 [Echinococcus granulosus]
MLQHQWHQQCATNLSLTLSTKDEIDKDLEGVELLTVLHIISMARNQNQIRKKTHFMAQNATVFIEETFLQSWLKIAFHIFNLITLSKVSAKPWFNFPSIDFLLIIRSNTLKYSNSDDVSSGDVNHSTRNNIKVGKNHAGLCDNFLENLCLCSSVGTSWLKISINESNFTFFYDANKI